MVTGYEELAEKKYLLTEPCDFTEANAILAKERERCLNWLKEAVDPDNCEKKAFSTDDITDLKLRRIDNTMRINAIKCNSALTDRKYFSCRNIYDYLDKIVSDNRELIIFISVKDTPGFALNGRINTKLAKLGIKTSLVDKHWHSFVAVIDSGRVINEVISKKDERVAYVGKLSCGDVKVVSRSYNAGNIAYISVNGVDYSENRRGLNIVVYDKLIGEVVDSICFDTHDEKLPYFRYGKKFVSTVPNITKYEIVGDRTYSIEPPETFSKDKLDAFYCCRLAVEKSADEAMFTRLGFSYIDDYIYRYIRPITIKDRDYTNEPYHDIFMNNISGGYGQHTSITLTGFNVKIDFGTNPLFRGNSNLSITCSGNSSLSIGDKITFNGENKIVMLDDYYSQVEIGSKLVITDTQWWLYAQAKGTEMIIGDNTTTNTNNRFLCHGGQRLIIGKDVMFSVNIRLICGDGHSIFDVKSGKNTNSIPEELSPRKKELIIGNHVWVGMNATILAGTNISDGSIIGANSLVKGVFSNNCAVGGNPAKLIKRDVAWSRRNCCTDISACGSEYINFTQDALNDESKVSNIDHDDNDNNNDNS